MNWLKGAMWRLFFAAVIMGGGGLAIAANNFALTQGSGTTFASFLISSVEYPAHVQCDPVAGATQCQTVNSNSSALIDENTSSQFHTDLTAPIVAGTNVIGYTTNDPCSQATKINVPISTASGTTALVTGVSAKKVYVCSLSLIVPSAVSVSLSEGSGTTCGTSNQAGVIGVATNGTAANGMALPANGGLTLGNGSGTVAVTATAADYLCLFQSGTAQIAGNITYVQQ